VNAPIGIREVAAHAGVSVGTVSNVLNRPDIVAATTKDRVHAAIRELGFVRNESARQLRAGRSRMIGLIVLDLANPFFTDVARGVEDEASKSGLAVILCNSDDQLPKETGHLELLEEHRVQGILITAVADNEQRLAQLQSRGTPVVLVDSRSPSGSQCSVAVDDQLGGDMAVSHLLAAGHERIADVGGPFNLRQVSDRRDGALRALARAGSGPSGLMVIETPALNVSAAQAAAAEIAVMDPAVRPAGVFCANDLIALGLLQELTQRRIRVPDDIAIAGYDDIDFAAAATVPCPRSASRASRSAAPSHGSCSRKPWSRTVTSTARSSSSLSWRCDSPARPGHGRAVSGRPARHKAAASPLPATGAG